MVKNNILINQLIRKGVDQLPPHNSVSYSNANNSRTKRIFSYIIIGVEIIGGWGVRPPSSYIQHPILSSMLTLRCSGPPSSFSLIPTLIIITRKLLQSKFIFSSSTQRITVTIYDSSSGS